MDKMEKIRKKMLFSPKNTQKYRQKTIESTFYVEASPK